MVFTFPLLIFGLILQFFPLLFLVSSPFTVGVLAYHRVYNYFLNYGILIFFSSVACHCKSSDLFVPVKLLYFIYN